MSDKNRRRLGEAVLRRRVALGLTQAGLRPRGGPSVVVVGQIERAEGPHPSQLTLAGLDRALGWEDGSAAGMLEGGEPKPLPRAGALVAVAEPAAEEEDPVIAAIRANSRLLPEARTHLLNQYQLLLRLTTPAAAVTPAEILDTETAEEIDAMLAAEEAQTAQESQEAHPKGR